MRDWRPEHLIVRIDRTDPSKNIVRGFLAYEKLLAHHPELKGRVQFWAFLQPSRQDVAAYRNYVRRVRKILSDLDYQTYLGLFENMVLHEPMFPELLIYLDCQPETAMARIRRRGRPMEQGVKLDYLKALQQAYYEFLDEMKTFGVSVLKVDWDEFMPLSQLVGTVRKHRESLPPQPAARAYFR